MKENYHQYMTDRITVLIKEFNESVNEVNKTLELYNRSYDQKAEILLTLKQKISIMKEMGESCKRERQAYPGYLT